MDFLINKINAHLDEQLIKITISNPRKAEEIKKYSIRPVLVKEQLLFQSAAYTKTQVFHENLNRTQLADKLKVILPPLQAGADADHRWGADSTHQQKR